MNLTERSTNIVRELIKIKSLTYQEKDAAEWVANFLVNLGFDTRIDSSNNVIGELKGKKSYPRILLLGHHDTVEEGNSSLWKYPPFSGHIVNGELWGRGAVDEKGGLGCALASIEKLIRDDHAQLYGDILFISTREETSEIATRGIKKILEQGIKADYCIVLEPTELGIVLGHKGRIVLEISTYGKAAHTGVPWKGVNAINHMAAIILELEKMSLPNRNPLGQGTQSIGIIKGGVRSNTVCDKCTIEMDRRIISEETPETVYNEISKTIASLSKKIPNLKYEINIKTAFYPSYIKNDAEIAKLAKISFKESGLSPNVYYATFHTDGEWIVNDAKIPAIVFGPGSIKLAHSIDERVSISDLGKAAEFYYRILKKNIFRED